MRLQDKLKNSDDVRTLLQTLETFVENPTELPMVSKVAGEARAALQNFLDKSKPKASDIIKFVKLSSLLNHQLNANNLSESTGSLYEVRRDLADFGFPSVGGYKSDEQLETLVGNSDQLSAVIDLQQQMGNEMMQGTSGGLGFFQAARDDDKTLRSMELLESIKQNPDNIQAIVQDAGDVDVRVTEFAEEMQQRVGVTPRQ